MRVCAACGTENPAHAKFCLECGTRFEELARESPQSRRTVTVLFCDLVDSTMLGEALDAETLHAVVGRYFTTMQTVIERHGGTVEKFIGDAIMAVFGLPVLHEDDALRAIRAAAEMRESLAALNVELTAAFDVKLAVRIGVHTGEVLAADASARQAMVTGDPVNTAARLEQAAKPGEILIGGPTYDLVRYAVETEAVDPVAAKGKATAVRAFRLVSVRSAVASSASGTEFFGRAEELARLRGALEVTVTTGHPRRITMIGPPGVGKSRLVERFLDGVDPSVRVVRGRCLSYGEAITYWPLREIVHQVVGIRAADSSAESVAKLRAFLVNDADADVVVGRIASAIGLSPEPAVQDEIFWAVRRFIDHLAGDGSLVALVEDLHWADPTLLALLEHVVARSDHAILVVGTARPELIEAASGWTEDAARAETVVLGGLSPEAAEALIDSMPGSAAIPRRLRDRIVSTGEGNALFIEELARMFVEEGSQPTGEGGLATGSIDEVVAIPPTIQALLASRVDRLPPSERGVAQRGSVVGRVFEAESVVALSDRQNRTEIQDALLALVRREVVAPDHAELSAADAYSFRHILLRDAAYQALRKADRAELHERFADWLENAAGSRRREFEEILGYHLAEAHRYRRELRQTGPTIAAIGQRAFGYLVAAGSRARDRGDAAAAIRLYRQAERLPAPDERASCLVDIDHGLSLFELGSLAEARTRAARALDQALRLGEAGLAARARLLLLDLSLAEGTIVNADPAAKAEAEIALREAEQSGDERAQADALSELSNLEWNAGHVEMSAELLARALEHARRSDDVRFALELELNVLVAVFSSQPADDVLVAAEALLERATGHPSIIAQAGTIIAVSEAQLLRFDDALARASESIRVLVDLGQFVPLVNARTFVAWIYRLQSDRPAAEGVLRLALQEAEAVGDRGQLSFVSCRLAENLISQGRMDEAERLLEEADRDRVAASASRIVGVRARIQAARGDPAAEETTRSLLAMVADWPWPNVKAEAYVDAANATALMGDIPKAIEYAREARSFSLAKRNLAMVSQIDGLLAQLTN